MNSSGYGGTSSSSGALLQLLAIGAMDSLLSRSASRTHWRGTYNRCTMFSLESINMSFSGATQFGGENTCTISRSGDLLWKCYVKIVLPGLSVMKKDESAHATASQQVSLPSADCSLAQCADNSHVLQFVGDGYTERSDEGKADMLRAGAETWEQVRFGCAPKPVGFGGTNLYEGMDYQAAYWCDCAGFAIIKRAALRIGGSVVDCTWDLLLLALEELEGVSGRRLSSMVGKTWRSLDKLVEASRSEQVLFVPMPWFFCKNPCQALPLLNLNYHNIYIDVSWAPLTSLVIRSHCDLLVLNSKTMQPLQDSDLSATLEGVFVHLDTQERDNLLSSSEPTKFLYAQHQAKKMTITSPTVECNLGFSFCVTSLIWMVRRKAHFMSGDIFNFSGVMGKPAILSAAITMNNSARVSAKCESFFRELQPYQHWLSLPLARILTYSFSLYPYNCLEPSGSVNCSRLDSMCLELLCESSIGSGSEEADLFVFARNWQMLSIAKGMASVSFSS